MKVLVLGGAGDMGSHIVRALASRGAFDEVHVGDVNRERGMALAAEAGERCRYVHVDARQADQLVRLLRGYDVAVSALGPFYEFGPPLARAALEAGTNYVDICDDYDAAEQILALHEAARSRGMTVITGMGWTPGLSNLLAKYAYERLGGAAQVRVHWVGSAADSRGLAVIMHLLYAITGRVPMYLEGRRSLVEAGSGKEEVLFPEPIGRAFTYYTGHPEPVTLPLYLRGLSSVEVKGGLVPDWQNGLGRFFVKLRLTSTPGRRRRLAELLHRIEDVFRSGGVECSAVRVDVSSPSGSLGLAAADRMGRLTALPAALCAELLAKGRVAEPGCYAPEGCLPALPLLVELARQGLGLFELKGQAWQPLPLPT
ncbi:MAG: hypothetical protein C4339_05960 [Nitrososphaerota archaeon]